MNERLAGGIPAALAPHFQEYDIAALNLRGDADLILQRTLEFGAWEEVRWLFGVYGAPRVRRFVREHGERWLQRLRLTIGVSCCVSVAGSNRPYRRRGVSYGNFDAAALSNSKYGFRCVISVKVHRFTADFGATLRVNNGYVART